MQETIKAIYENGVLRPLQPLPWLQEKSEVQVTVTAESQAHPLADCVGILPDEDAEEMRRIIESEFKKVNPDDWK